jgi:ubiquinone biosynthesis protein
VNEARLGADLAELALDFSDAPLKDLKIGTLLHRLTAILREHSIALPPDLALLFKALLTLEGAGRHYDPEFRLVERAEPFLNRALSERYQPADAWRRGKATLGDSLRLITSLPEDLARLVKDARHGRIRVDLDLKRLDTFGDRLHNAVDRATIGLMTASLVIGSSIVMTVEGGPKIFGVSLLTYCGFVGYLIAFVNSLWIIFSIWRSRRR